MELKIQCRKKVCFGIVALIAIISGLSVFLYFKFIHSGANDSLPIDYSHAIIYNEGSCKLTAFNVFGNWNKTTKIFNGNDNGKKCHFDVYLKDTIFYNDDFSSIKSTSAKYSDIKLPVNEDTIKQNISTYGYVLTVEHKSNNIYALSADDRYELDKLIIVDAVRREHGTNDAYFNIILTHLESPKQVAFSYFDPDRIYMYIIQKSGIFQYTPDGDFENVRIYKTGITSMAIDNTNGRFYLTTDGLMSTIERFDNFGTNKQQIVATTNILSSVTQAGSKMFWLESFQQHEDNLRCTGYDDRCKYRMLQIAKGNGVLRGYNFTQFSSRKRLCNHDNGGCEHLCLTSYSYYTCRCKLGYRLRDDLRSCEAITVNASTSVMLYVRGTYVSKRLVNKKYFKNEPFAEIMYPLRVARNNIISFDLLNENHFYATDGQYLYRRHLQRNEGIEILAPGIRAVAVDWAASQVYVAKKNMILVLPYDFKSLSMSKVVYQVTEPNQEIMTLAVQSNRGYVFFVQKELDKDIPIIYRMNSDGSDVKLFYDNKEKGLLDITVDDEGDKLCWLAHKNKIVECTPTFDSSNKTRFELSINNENFKSISIAGDWIFTSDSIRINRYNKTVKWDYEEVYSTYTLTSQPIMGHYIYTADSQNVKDNNYPCAYGAHSCERFCFAKQQSNDRFDSKCGCFDGEILSRDKYCI